MENVLIERAGAAALRERYHAVRGLTERLCEPLATEDYVVQSMEDVSPTKWHLAHTTWFFETFLVQPHAPGYRPLDPRYGFLFNSYYVQAGERHCRAQRGYLSRPTVAEVYAYRTHVDQAVARLLEGADEALLGRLAPLVELGVNHEQQHQELLLTDIKHVFSVNPLRPAYRPSDRTPSPHASTLAWVSFPGGVHQIGHDGRGFAFDNEGPRHRTYLEPFQLGHRLVTNGEYLEFMADGGYRRAELWLSLGWATASERGWTEPFYWELRDGRWWHFTLAGMRPVDAHEPVTHLSYFEADAYARWAGARLPTEEEWEVGAAGVPVRGSFVESGELHPRAPSRPPRDAGASTAAASRAEDGEPGAPALLQMYGDAWQWTKSPYVGYPGYAPDPGALGEYNGKFMCNQFVLRGGSCATSQSHIRPTYRNFFPPDATWQFTGLRLARDT